MGVSILVLGGCGFVGRYFICHVIENQLASSVRVVDRVLPQMSFLDARCQAAFQKVEYMQVNLVNSASLSRAFVKPDGTNFDYVFNLAAETKFGQTEMIYRERIYQLSLNCGKEAASRGVKAFVHLSTAQIYNGDQKQSKEDDKLQPWTNIAKFHLEAEEQLKAIPGINLIIIRPALIYGPGDTQGLTPRLVTGRVYKKLKEKMNLLWSKELRINTVHVIDVARALWDVTDWYTKENKTGTSVIFNLADKGDTDQAKLNQIIGKIFGIETGFQGSIVSTFAEHNMSEVLEEANDKHVPPWSKLLEDSGIYNSPLTPFLDPEQILNKNLSVDGTKISEVTGFEYQFPSLTEEELQKVILGFKELGLWPKDNI